MVDLIFIFLVLFHVLPLKLIFVTKELKKNHEIPTDDVYTHRIHNMANFFLTITKEKQIVILL